MKKIKITCLITVGFLVFININLLGMKRVDRIPFEQTQEYNLEQSEIDSQKEPSELKFSLNLQNASLDDEQENLEINSREETSRKRVQENLEINSQEETLRKRVSVNPENSRLNQIELEKRICIKSKHDKKNGRLIITIDDPCQTEEMLFKEKTGFFEQFFSESTLNKCVYGWLKIFEHCALACASLNGLNPIFHNYYRDKKW